MAVRERRVDPRRAAARAHHHRWVETTGANLLVVDPDGDDGALAAEMTVRGVHVTWAADMLDALVAFGRTEPHLVLVSPHAPGLEAGDFVSAVREQEPPCAVALVADGDDDHLGAAVLAGASAVLTRPYDADRIWSLLVAGPRPVSDHARLVVGPIELDAGAFTVRLDGERINDLPLKEFELLRALMLHAPDVVSDESLREALWGGSGRRPGGNTISMHVTRLRGRLGGVADVRRVRGRGYSLTVG